MLKKILLPALFFFVGLLVFFTTRFILVNQNIRNIISPASTSKFSLATAPSQSLTAQVISFSGNVLWQSRIAKIPTKMMGLVTLQQGEELETQKNGSLSLVFPDVATINLSSDSILNIIQTLPANIVLQQNKGTIAYMVTSSTIPFSVRGLDLLIDVQGQVQIEVDNTNNKVMVLTKAGSATLAYNDTNNVSHVIEIHDGQKVVFDNDAKEIE